MRNGETQQQQHVPAGEELAEKQPGAVVSNAGSSFMLELCKED